MPVSEQRALRHDVERFQAPVTRKSMLQLLTSFGGFFATCAAMYVLYEFSYWMSLALTPVAAGFLVRIFVIQHDCGHLSFFRSRRINDCVGLACSLLTLAPYASWRRQHAGHHRVWNDLDRRQSGADFYSSCLTVDEYRALGPLARWWYRTTRHPVMANLLLPPLIFIVLYRLPFDMPKTWRRERCMVHVTTLMLIGVFGGAGLLLGFDRLAGVHLPVLAIAAIVGVWLFSVQHRGRQVRWFRHDAWDPTSAALWGSTYLQLPSFLQWFTGNIGFHHVHHLNSRVPNYRLEACHASIAPIANVRPMTIWEAIHALSLILWDERAGRMVSINDQREVIAR